MFQFGINWVPRTWALSGPCLLAVSLLSSNFTTESGLGEKIVPRVQFQLRVMGQSHFYPAIAGPAPIRRIVHEAASHWIPVAIIRFRNGLFHGPNVKIITSTRL